MVPNFASFYCAKIFRFIGTSKQLSIIMDVLTENFVFRGVFNI